MIRKQHDVASSAFVKTLRRSEGTSLALAVGMILFISAVNDEVGYRSSTMQEEGGFSYSYGWSFFTAGVGFLATEMAAVGGITLFLKRNEDVEEMVKIIPGLEGKVDPDLLYVGSWVLSSSRSSLVSTQYCRGGRAGGGAWGWGSNMAISKL
nr:hypothetical protein BaRGS_006705 [Batillaria attramentaria]